MQHLTIHYIAADEWPEPAAAIRDRLAAQLAFDGVKGNVIHTSIHPAPVFGRNEYTEHRASLLLPDEQFWRDLDTLTDTSSTFEALEPALKRLRADVMTHQRLTANADQESAS